MYPSQQNAADQTSNLFWLIVLFFAAGIIFWFTAKEYLIVPLFWLRSAEIDLIRYLAEGWTPIARFFHLSVPDIARLNALQHYVQTAAPKNVSWRAFATINAEIGKWTRYPIIIFFLLLAVFVYLRGGAQFQHTYSMKTLSEAGQEVWPQITPVLSIDLVKEDIDKGPWAMAKLPLDFCREHDLLVVKTVGGKKIWSLKQKPTYRLFALQIGPMWKGLDALPIHLKALALVFFQRATGQRPAARAILSQIAASAATGKLDFTDVSNQLQAFKDHRILNWLEKRHAYVSSLMATLIEIARSDGVLASAEFLWLKPVDRRMWFMLNNVGRSTAFVEVAGAFAHWKAEKKLGRALKTPMVKAAVDALDETLQNILFVEEGDQWRTRNEA